ncbi:MAG: sortase [Bacilli bacterium]|nr:sortase [Bacilli bacterium]
MKLLKEKISRKKKNMKPSTIAAIAALIAMIGLYMISYNYVQAKKVVAFDYMANGFYNGEEIIPSNDKDIKKEKKKHKKKEPEVKIIEDDNYDDSYIGYLSIPKINLTKGFVDRRSKENNVEKNIIVVDGSNYPNVKKGNLILAGHSGSGWKAFFNDLIKLSTGDTMYVTYKHKIYEYKLVNIYKQDKVGKLSVYRNYDKTTLTLITCTNNDSKTQTVYISELQKVRKK